MNQAEIDRLQAENASLKAKIQQTEQAENIALVDELVTKGKLSPATKTQAIALLNYAQAIDHGETVDFAENGNFQQAIKAFLSNLPKIIEFAEIATKENAPDDKRHDVVQYAEGTPAELIELDQSIRSYAKQHKIDYLAAFNIITKKGATA